jgi:hypothetical protein
MQRTGPAVCKESSGDLVGPRRRRELLWELEDHTHLAAMVVHTAEALHAIVTYLEGLSSQRRSHSALGFLSSVEFEQRAEFVEADVP